MSDERSRVPAWLIGLVITAVIFAIVVYVFDAFGFADEPAIQSLVWHQP